MPDLSRLSDGERRVLGLLAQGHTAKSIATELGLSENAVNERLREARRKTGVGSSRELARLLRAASGAQEIRDKEIGVALRGPTATLSPETRPRLGWPVLTGVLGLIILASAVAVLALAAGDGTAKSGPPAVVATYPAGGAVAPAGPLSLSVTFDRPMRAGSYSFVIRDPKLYPACQSTPVQSRDRRTFTLSCVVEPGRTYLISFNSERFRNFVSEADGTPATPAILRFSTR